MIHFTPYLELQYDGEIVGKVSVNKNEFVIGRNRGSNLRLTDISISRKHCKLKVLEAGEVLVEDLSSTNGTFLNGQRIVNAKVSVSDVLHIGRCSLIFKEMEVSENHQPSSIIKKIFSRQVRPRFSKPFGKYVLPEEDIVTEFDAIAFRITKDQESAEHFNAKAEYLKQLPRLTILASQDPQENEQITRFDVDERILFPDEKADGTPEVTEVILPQPLIKLPKWKLPWKSIEKLLIPTLLAILLVLVGRSFLTIQIDSELKKAEKHWDERLLKLGEQLRFVSDAAFETRDLSKTALEDRRSNPLSIKEVWQKIDSHPNLRNFLFFEILDELINAQNLKWSLDDALKNLSKIRSVTSRIPSIKQIRVVLNSKITPVNVKGIEPQRLIFFMDRPSSGNRIQSYETYKNNLTGKLGFIEQCGVVRRTSKPVDVIAGFTVLPNGKPATVFVNEATLREEKNLGHCIRARLEEASFERPPQGSLSIIYTFKFGSAAKVEF